jgi:hypothetical protein
MDASSEVQALLADQGFRNSRYRFWPIADHRVGTRCQ